MELLYFKSEKGNFGDDLNDWLWPKMIDFHRIKEVDYFVGIGSLLDQDNSLFKGSEQNTKMVFGTGVRPSRVYKNFVADKTWDIKFLRGPLSNYALGNKFEYITDGAYAMRQLDNFSSFLNVEKKYEVSLMPYFHSVEYFDWKKLCDVLGYNYISPLSENGVEHTIREIAASKHLITEAMHGAIIADILRVPWHKYVLTTPYTEGSKISDFKWNDWLYSIDTFVSSTTFIPFYIKTRFYKSIKSLFSKRISVEFFLRKKVEEAIINSLRGPLEYTLSKDATLDAIDSKISGKIDCLTRLYQ